MANTVLYSPSNTKEATLSVFNSKGLVGVYELKERTTLGRIIGDIILDSPVVSRSHGEIYYMQNRFWYRDIGSTNGTYINERFLGQRSSNGVSVSALQEGDVIRFANPKDPESKIIAVFSGEIKSRKDWLKVPLSKEIAEICIGRSPSAGLSVDNEMVSEKHASFFCAEKGWAIIDHNSTNGVMLNGVRLTTPAYLTQLDELRIVNISFVFFEEKLYCSSGILSKNTNNISKPSSLKKANTTNATPDKSPSLYINIVHRSVSQRFRKMMLLQDINISVNSGEMILILGGSGAGKTTFINAVMGYEKAVGKIIYKNTDIYQEYERMKYEIGFVPQQDLLRASDTVYDTVANAAEMKLPITYSDAVKKQRIQLVLDELGLSREKDSLVSKLSGGQRKRLSIAVEFIADPGLFFLDEPDSGIDDIMGRAIMENLRKIADSGKIVMIITHSPERAVDLFDKVIVLAKSAKDNCGHLAFYGSPKDAYEFFDTDSFRGILKKINRPDENGEGLSDYYIEKYRRNQ